MDEHGNVVYGDMLLLIYAREILARKPGATFIGEVKCSQVMYDEINQLGGNAIMYKTGHSLIKAKMKQEHAELAGEMSGHMFFADRYRGFDDALVRRLPADRDRREIRAAAFGAARRDSENGFDARNSRRLPRRTQVRHRAPRRGTFQSQAQDCRHRRRTRHLSTKAGDCCAHPTRSRFW